jgi:hypothetical protein
VAVSFTSQAGAVATSASVSRPAGSPRRLNVPDSAIERAICE